MSTGNNQSERNSGNAGVSSSNTPPTTFMQRISWLGGKVLDIAERVGEGVVSFLGNILKLYINTRYNPIF